MLIKLLQLNIFQGIFMDEIISFVNETKIDILNFQEVTKGGMSRGGEYNYPHNLGAGNDIKKTNYKNLDCFETVKKESKLDGTVVYTSTYVSDPNSGVGNATFWNKNIKLIDKKIVWLKEFEEITPEYNDIPNLSRAALILKFEIKSTQFYVINVHMTWGPNPNDEDYKINQAQKLYDQIKKLDLPFILTGDFNVTPNTKTSSMFDNLARNWTKEIKISNTLNEKIHSVKKLFPPGLAVDYIFTSPEIKALSVKVVDEIDLSDHYGLLLEFEI